MQVNGPPVMPVGFSFDAGDKENAEKTTDAMQVSGLSETGAVWKKIL
ncbi:hypothetical protein [Dialister invisus]|nr:hypothetical protein [Dialister invisus]